MSKNRSRAEIIKQLAALIRLSERGSTPGEQENAADKIARLIRRYRISPEELARAGASEMPGYDVRVIEFGRNEQWPKSLGFLVARAEGCSAMSMKGRVVFAGLPARMDESVKRYWHIHSQMVAQYARYGHVRPKEINPGMWRLSFMMGMLKRLSERLPTRETPGSPYASASRTDPSVVKPDVVTTAIVLARHADSDKNIKEHFNARANPWKVPKQRSGEAFDLGYLSASQITLWSYSRLPARTGIGRSLAEAFSNFRLTQ